MLKEYLGIIKLVATLALTAALFVGGCVYGQNTKAEENATLSAQVTELTAVNSEWAEGAEETQKQLDANKRFAREQEELAERLAKENGTLRKDTQKRVRDYEKQRRAADKEPTCSELLERQLCPLLSLPSRP